MLLSAPGKKFNCPHWDMRQHSRISSHGSAGSGCAVVLVPPPGLSGSLPNRIGSDAPSEPISCSSAGMGLPAPRTSPAPALHHHDTAM
jgi:hypothetical protein